MVSADNLNLDVLELIFAYLAGTDLASVALVSRAFLSGVIPRLYGTLRFRFRQAKRYPSLMSPFVSILNHPQLAVHVRHVEIRAIPTLKGNPQPHPKFLNECIRALTLCTNLSSFKYDGVFLPPFLSCLQDKPRLHALSVNAGLTIDQALKLAQITGLRSLTLEYASWTVMDALPKWIGSLKTTLRELTIHMAADLNDCVLSQVLAQLPNLRALHVVGCPKIDHDDLMKNLKHVPLLESLAFSVSDTPSLPIHPPLKLTHLRHLALDMRCMHTPTPTHVILSSVLFQINYSFPPLSSFVFRTADCSVQIPDTFIQDLIHANGSTLTRVALINCEITNETLDSLCEDCIHLECLELGIPVKDIIVPSIYDEFFPPIFGRTPSDPPNGFVDALAKSASLRTLIDRNDMHASHGPQPILSSDAVHFMMTEVAKLRTIVNDKKVWTGSDCDDDIRVTLKRPKSSYSVNDWFLPRN